MAIRGGCPALLAPALLASALLAQPPKPPAAGDLKAIDSEIAKLVRGDAAVRRAAIVQLIRREPHGRDRLVAAADKEGAEPALKDALRDLDLLVGGDIERRTMSVDTPPWSLWTAPAGEVLVI